MFTYGYIREATMAHLDIDESEAKSMDIEKRFHIFANEAMQAICSNKPKYQYIDITVVEEYAPLVMDGAIIRLATEEEINWDEEVQGSRLVPLLNEYQTQEYYHKQNIYKKLDTLSMSDTFIAFADKQAYKIVELKPTMEQLINDETNESTFLRQLAIEDEDFSYISKNQIKFYKAGQYEIPAKFLWHRFDSGLGDKEELDIPADIFLTIPLYVASICLQIDNTVKAQIKRNEFELALSRCTSTDFMPLNKVKSSW